MKSQSKTEGKNSAWEYMCIVKERVENNLEDSKNKT